jgi:hypothetical protein
MGILGDTELVRRTRSVTIGLTPQGEEFKVEVRAPRLQLIPELRTKIPEPEPPPLRNSAGKVRFRTDPKTGEPIKQDGQLVPMLDWKSPDYLVQTDSVERARTVAMIFECAAFPGESEIKREAFSTQVDYWLARWRELEDAGVDVGAYKELSDACVELGAPMSRSEVEDARRALGTDSATQDAVKDKLGGKAPAGK